MLETIGKWGKPKIEGIYEQKPKSFSHRKSLDEIVFDALCLREYEGKEVHCAVAELLENHMDNANSV